MFFSNHQQPELIVLPLRMAVSVYSGIAPPPALLKAVSVKRPAVRPSEPVEAPAMPPRPAPEPIPAYDTQPPQPDMYEDAPPSYEDAMADEIGPVDGPRREYNSPDAAFIVHSGSGADTSTTAGSGSKDSERLFPDTGNWGHSTDSFARFSETPPESPIEPQASGESQESGRWENQLPPEKRPLDVQPPQPSSSPPPPPPPPPMEQPRRSDFRTLNINMGVPSRKPVPKNTTSPTSPNV